MFPRGSLPALASRAEEAPNGRLLSNGRWTTVLTGAGTGFAECAGRRLTYWRGDRIEDPDGVFVYVRDRGSGACWSVGRAPMGRAPDEYEARWAPGWVRIRRREDAIEATLDAWVAPEADAEIRRITLTNRSRVARVVDVTTYAEVALHDPEAFAAHPAFAKLFVQTAVDERAGALLVTRRPRGDAPEPCVLAHALHGPGPLTWETSRTRFIGRGRSVRCPIALDEALTGTAGAVLDPIVALRRSVDLPARGTVTLLSVLACAPAANEAAAVSARWRTVEDAETLRAAAEAWAARQAYAAGIEPADAEYLHALAVWMWYGAPALRAGAAVATRVRGTPADLVRLGISPNRPFVLWEPGEGQVDPAMAAALAAARAYWRAHGLDVDAYVMLGGGEGSGAPLPPGLRVVPATGAEPGLLDVARAAAALLLGRTWPSLREGTTPVADDPAGWPPPPPAPDPPRGGAQRLFDNGYGGFALGGDEYVIDVPGAAGPRPPMPWTNVLANESVGCVVSESGAGCTWSRNSREHRLTPWSNDPVVDPHGEALYVRDEATGEFWSPQPGPAGGGAPYEVRHGFGYSTWTHRSHGLVQEVVTFVPPADPVRLTTVTLRNPGPAPRRVSVIWYAHLVLGERPDEGSHLVVTTLDPATGAIHARRGVRASAYDGVVVAAVVGAGGAARAATADRAAFLGRGGSPAAPLALRSPGLLVPRFGAGRAPCAALQVVLDVAPGGTARCTVLLGDVPSDDAARALVRRYDAPGVVEAALASTRTAWRTTVGAIAVRSPEPALDLMLNGWAAYQTIACRLLARTAFYQSGGAFGFRDQLQDAAALAWIRPDLTRAQLLLHAAHQFPEGDVLHWWHPATERGTRTRMVDDRLWLPYLTAFYVRATGDAGILDESADFVTARALAPGEDEAYLAVRPAGAPASVYEHCCRAIDRSLGVGAHGLPLMGTGDWNDGMNRVGREGRGESVWMGFFLHAVLADFAPLADARGDGARAAQCRAHAAALAAALEREAWDGQWYRRAWFDDGNPLGSAANDECRIDVLPQAWAVLSGAAPPDRARAAMEAVARELVIDPPGLLRLLAPPFDRTAAEPGYIKGYVPGIRENGGQYTHAALWAVRAFAELGDRARAAALLARLTPVWHTRTPEAVARYQVEPYVVAADVYAAPEHLGRGGWTWYTGSAGWFVRVAFESILGIRVEDGQRLVVRPCIPDAWPGFECVYRLPDDETRYVIAVANPTGAAAQVCAAAVDGVAARVAGGAAVVPLVRDGGVHRVSVTLGAASASPDGENR